MKLHRLELEGFGPFRDRQVVDFDAFDDDGIFLISGRTGAGKSSILDGVCFALYGMVPRYEGAGKRLRSDHCAPDEPTRVVLEFSAHSRRYRVVRSPEYDRPKARGEGMTPEKARVEVSVRDGDGWRGLTTHAKEAGTLITDEIVGLTGAQFLQVILLAQNKFADFLLAGNDERQALLRNLFGSRTYVDYEAALEQRRRDSQRTFDKRGDAVEFLLTDAERLVAEHGLGRPAADEDPAAAVGDGMPTAGEGRGAESASITSDAVDTTRPGDPTLRLAELERAILRARYAADQAGYAQQRATEERSAAQAALTAQTTLRENQLKRLLARDALERLEAAAPEIAALRAALAAALDAEALRASLESVAAAEHARDARAMSAAASEREWTAAGGDAEIDRAALDTLIDTLTGNLRLWHDALAQERALGELEAGIDQLNRRIEEAELRVGEARSQREIGRARLTEFEDDLAEARALAMNTDALAQTLTSLRAQREAAAQVIDFDARTRAADEHHAVAAAAHADAVSEVSALLQRRLAGAAGELAADLVDGEPCAVCGSIEHPRPAAPHTERITDDDIDRAQRAADEARMSAATAAQAARDAQSRLTEARARADGAEVDELDQRIDATQSAVDAAREAAARADLLAQERAQTMQSIERAEQNLADATASAGSAKEERAGLAATAAAARAAVVDAAGAFASVAERIEHASAQRDRARALRDAQSELVIAREALATATDDLSARIHASSFHDVASVRAALMPAHERAQADARVREHDADLAARKEALRSLEIELAGAPEELVDTEPARSALARAEDSHAIAAAAATTARVTAERLGDVHSRAERAHAQTAEAAAQHRLIVGLADAVAGRNAKKMDLETFVLAAELEQIVIAAGRRLEDMSSGRYRLRHTDALAARNRASGLGLEVVDAHTGKARSPQSLSGGETFLASLALALGLAEVVTARAGGVTLDTLFIDEGFGSLDAETLEMAMSTLDELRQGGRTVGIISHVAAMKERIPARVEVEASTQGASTIRQDNVARA